MSFSISRSRCRVDPIIIPLRRRDIWFSSPSAPLSALSLRQNAHTALRNVNADAGRERRFPNIVGTVANGYGETIGSIVNQSRPAVHNPQMEALLLDINWGLSGSLHGLDGPILHRDPIVPLITRDAQLLMVILFVPILLLHANNARSPFVAWIPEANAFNFHVYNRNQKRIWMQRL